MTAKNPKDTLEAKLSGAIEQKEKVLLLELKRGDEIEIARVAGVGEDITSMSGIDLDATLKRGFTNCE